MKNKLNEESIKPLSEAEYRQEAEPQLRKIFLNDNYQLPNFGVNAEIKKVLYEYWTPDEQVMNTIARAASNLGDTGFYISIINKTMPGTSSERPEHWWVPFSELSTYLSVNTDIFHFAYQLENVIYSPQGKWGIIYTFNKHGILGGVESFMEEFCRSFPSIDQQILDFLNYARECIDEYGLGQVNIGWLGGFLKQVYGFEQARVMLQESQLTSYINIENSNPQNTSDNLAPSTRSPVATQQGMDELKATLAASDPTDNPSVRRVVITIPEGVPDFMRLREASSTATRVFHLVIMRSSSRPERTTGDELYSQQGIRGKLPNGGTIALRIRKVNEDNGRGNIGEIFIRDHQISGYEQVELIEFVSD